MALIPYPYDAATQDLWLYEPHTITWSSGTAGVFRPYAWNPASPLYGYRYSLEGIVARYRTFSTGAVDEDINVSAYLPYNDINDPANRPAYFNSYPPSGWLLNDVAIMACGHCFDAQLNSRSSETVEQWRGSGSYLNAATIYRWIRGDGTIVDVSTSQVLRPFANDAGYQIWEEPGDICFLELMSPSSVTPMHLVDHRTAHAGDIAWFIDGSDKIVTALLGRGWISPSVSEQITASVRYDRPSLSVPDIQAYLHDSGSYFIVPIKPPSDPVLGDGIAGLMPFHMVASADFSAGLPTNGANVLAGSSIRNYWTSYRGKSFPAMSGAYPTNSYVPCTSATAASMDSAASSLLGAVQ
jgi:hypothetical protein